MEEPVKTTPTLLAIQAVFMSQNIAEAVGIEGKIWNKRCILKVELAGINN